VTATDSAQPVAQRPRALGRYDGSREWDMPEPEPVPGSQAPLFDLEAS
jgi:hypothetical protein